MTRFDTIASYLSGFGCRLLSFSKEPNGQERIKYIAKCGHENTLTYQSFRSGSGRVCKVCHKRHPRKRMTIYEIEKEYKDEGCQLISQEFNSVKDSLEYICRCGHRHSMPYYCFHRGQGRMCPDCSGNKKKTLEQVREIFLKEGCRLLSDSYKWNRQKLTYIAQCGHKHTIKASAFFEGEGRLCPECQTDTNSRARRKFTQKEFEDIFNSRGCKLLSKDITTASRAEYIAACGHKNEMAVVYFLQGQGTVCHECYKKNVSKGESQIKEVLIELGIKFKAQYRIKTDSSWYQRLDFYLPDFNAAIEFNGKQHYEESPFFHNNDRNGMAFSHQIERDERKRKWCKDNGVELIEIDSRRWSAKLIFKGQLKSFVRGLMINKGWAKDVQ